MSNNDEKIQPETTPSTSTASESASQSTDAEQDKSTLVRTLQQLKLTRDTDGYDASTAPKNENQARLKQYKFWDTQPVPKISEDCNEFVNGPIDPNTNIGEVSKEAIPLPKDFVWVNVNIDDEDELDDLYTLLYQNYVEDDDQMFRFNYSKNFLQWVLKPPGWKIDWWCGVRTAPKTGQDKPGKLCAFVSAVPAHVNIHQKQIQCVDINFLCVHKRLRSKRMTPVLIREITRRVNHYGIWQALYTAGVFIPKPISTARYYHRSINCKKLIECGFSALSYNQTISRVVKLNRLPDEIKLTGLRPMVKEDSKAVQNLLRGYLNKFDLSPNFNEEEVAHWFTPIKDVVKSFVLERVDQTTKKKRIVALASFYCLPSTVINNAKHKEIKAAYSFYNVVSEDVTLVQLMQDALIFARNLGYDVFNALDLMDNKEFIKELKFGLGDGNLHYYLFNWRCPEIPQDRVAVVLQ